MDPRHTHTAAESRLSRLLSVIAFLAFAASLVGLAGPNLLWPASTFFNAPPFLVANAAAGLALLALIAWFAAADVRRFRVMTFVLLGGLAIGAVELGVLIASPSGAGYQTPLLIGAVVFGLAAIVLGLAVRATDANALKQLPWIPDKPATNWERIGRLVFGTFGAGSLVVAVAGVALAFIGFAAFPDFIAQPVVLGLASTGLAVLGLCALLAANDLRRQTEMLTVVILGHGIVWVGSVLLGWGSLARFGGALTLNSQLLSLAATLDAALGLAFLGLKFLINRSIIDHLKFFTVLEFRALEGIAETLVSGGKLRQVPPYQIALRTDSYLSSFRSSRLWLSRAAVLGLETSPLLWFKPPLSFLDPELRSEFVDRHFKRDIVEPRGIYWVLARIGLQRVIDLLEGAVRFNMQLAYLGYYTDPQVHKAIGYTPFSERAKSFAVQPVRRYPDLQVMTPDVLDRRGIDVIPSADVVILGSGAAGSILAERLSAQGREVLLVERGAYTHPDNFSEDEVEMIGRLYGDGALQISQSMRFTILQGSSVGGTTVINNAVCFDTPDRVLRLWNEPNGLNACIDEPAFRAAQKAVRERMHIQSIKHSTNTRPWADVLNPGDGVIEKGIHEYLASTGHLYDVIDANIADCLGCGYCNIGCKYGRKLSMLDEVLPAAQAKRGREKFRILSEAEAVKLTGRNGQITEIEVKVQGRRQLMIRNPKTVIVSAGTIASSWLLMRSKIGEKELPVGRWLCFNMGSPLHGWFDQKLHSYAGLQIAHFLSLPDAPGEVPGFVYETWYNPPVAQALTMPGWLDTHFTNMQHYDEIAAVGVLVGTQQNEQAHLASALFLRGAPDVVYTPKPEDLATLAKALTTLGKIMFAGGAKTVFASTRKYQNYSAAGAQKTGSRMAVYQSVDELDGLSKLVQTERDILLGTGHPQGGNRISANRGRNGIDGGVIDPDFKVYGYNNLHVCDASVFPTATTVNPQLSVMTMAWYAADRINGK